jgi:hypothetical protein
VHSCLVVFGLNCPDLVRSMVDPADGNDQLDDDQPVN